MSTYEEAKELGLLKEIKTEEKKKKKKKENKKKEKKK